MLATIRSLWHQRNQTEEKSPCFVWLGRGGGVQRTEIPSVPWPCCPEPCRDSQNRGGQQMAKELLISWWLGSKRDEQWRDLVPKGDSKVMHLPQWPTGIFYHFPMVQALVNKFLVCENWGDTNGNSIILLPPTSLPPSPTKKIYENL